MTAKLACTVFLLEEAKKKDDLAKRRQAKQIRLIHTISRDSEYIKHYRLSEDLINQLESDLKPYLSVQQRSSGLSNRIKILCTLSFLGNGSYQKIIGKNVDTYISQTSVSRAIHSVVAALNNPEIIRKYIRFPQNSDERQILKERFYNKFKIPGVIGCVDGTLVSMIRPRHHEERYYCRKGYHARNVLIICDADLNILHVDATFGGATHDSFVFTNSIIKEHLNGLHAMGEKVYLLGDSGYAQRPFMMVPFNDPHEPSEEFYNDLHSTARNCIERTIGLLKGRFRCLLVHRVLHYDPKMVSKIVIACCVLHNLCNRAGLPAPNMNSNDLIQDSRLVATLAAHGDTTDNDFALGQLSRQELVSQLWSARRNLFLL